METIHDNGYKIYTDGACSGNPGKGAWAAIIVDPNGKRKETFQAYAHTTNNRMELRAVIASLQQIPAGAQAVVTTDSQYVANAINKDWLTTWRQKSWRTSQKKPVANRDLWEALASLLQKHSVRFVWVRGHEGHPENERCDELAVQAYTSGPWTEDEGYDSVMSTTKGQTSLL